jgi:hypothetical protein
VYEFYLTPRVDRTRQGSPRPTLSFADAAGVSAYAFRASAAYACVYPRLSDAYWSCSLDEIVRTVYEVRLDRPMHGDRWCWPKSGGRAASVAGSAYPEPTAESTQCLPSSLRKPRQRRPFRTPHHWTFAQQAESTLSRTACRRRATSPENRRTLRRTPENPLRPLRRVRGQPLRLRLPEVTTPAEGLQQYLPRRSRPGLDPLRGAHRRGQHGGNGVTERRTAKDTSGRQLT